MFRIKELTAFHTDHLMCFFSGTFESLLYFGPSLFHCTGLFCFGISMTLYKGNGRIMATGILKHLKKRKKKGKTIYWAKRQLY